MPKRANSKKSSDNTLSVITHLLGLFTGFIGALIVLLASNDKKNKNHARNALNWQISAWIYIIISIPLMLILIGFLTLFATILLNLIFCIIASVKASKGILWKYPLTIPFLKTE